MSRPTREEMGDVIARARDYADDAAGDMDDVVIVALADDLAEARALLESLRTGSCQCPTDGHFDCRQCKLVSFLARTK